MMGKQSEPQPALFHYGLNLEQRVRKNHPLRQVAALIDFDFAYAEVEEFYGAVGHESTPPPVILKLLFLLTHYNVRSERELLETLPERLDWLWFLGWEVDSTIPNHSVLSKARARWGQAVFRKLFEQVVAQCVRAGLINGRKAHCDSSMIDADASDEAVETAICVQVREEVEQRLSEDGSGQADEAPVEAAPKPQRYSTTDPEAAVVARRGRDRARPRYKTHRAVDDRHGVITATMVTAGDVNEGHRLSELIDQHQAATGVSLEVVVADTAYGTSENLLACNDRGIAPHLAVLKEKNNATAQRARGLFTRAAFRYEAATDTYRCPAGAVLKRSRKIADRWGLVSYQAAVRDCSVCPLKERCTVSDRRHLSRHIRQDELDQIEQRVRSARRGDLRRRKTLIEGSFGQAVRYGYKRARYRGRERVAIQDLLIAIVQNVMTLCRNGPRPSTLAQVQTASLLSAIHPIALRSRHVFTHLRLAAANALDLLTTPVLTQPFAFCFLTTRTSPRI